MCPQNSNTLLELIVIYGDDSVYGVVRELTPISYTRLQTVNLTRVNKASGGMLELNLVNSVISIFFKFSKTK